MTSSLTISLCIENLYDGRESVTTVETNIEVPAPEPGQDLQEWADENLFPLTGTGMATGSSCYVVEVTAASLPDLVGRTFEFGF